MMISEQTGWALTVWKYFILLFWKSSVWKLPVLLRHDMEIFIRSNKLLLFFTLFIYACLLYMNQTHRLCWRLYSAAHSWLDEGRGCHLKWPIRSINFSVECSIIKTISISAEGENQRKVLCAKRRSYWTNRARGDTMFLVLDLDLNLVSLILLVGKLSGLPAQSALVFMSNYTSRLNNLKTDETNRQWDTETRRQSN